MIKPMITNAVNDTFIEARILSSTTTIPSKSSGYGYFPNLSPFYVDNIYQK